MLPSKFSFSKLSFKSLAVSFLFEKVEDSVCERSVGWALLGLSRSQGGEGLFAGSHNIINQTILITAGEKREKNFLSLFPFLLHL